MSETDQLLQNAREWEASFANAGLPPRPGTRVAIVACMDARLDPAKIFGLSEGDAHVIRNAGGVVTDDVIRSLAVSQRRMGTEEIILLHHSDCGMLRFRDQDFRDAIARDAGERPEWESETFDDAFEDVRESIRRITESPFVPHKDSLRGFVHDDASGRLIEVVREPHPARSHLAPGVGR